MSNRRNLPTDPPPPQPPSGPFVGPSPVPQAYRVQAVTDARGQSLVCVSFSGPCGQWVVFLSPDGADALGEDLKSTAAEGRTGLQVVRDIATIATAGPDGK